MLCIDSTKRMAMQGYKIKLIKRKAFFSHQFAATASPGRQRGFSLIEAMVVVSILAIIVGIAVPSFKEFQANRRLNGFAVELATDIHYLRSEAIARNQKMYIRFGNDAGGSCYLLHTGNSGDCTCTSDGAAQCRDPMNSTVKSVGLADYQGVRLQANVTSMLFDPVRGTTTPGGSINIIADSGKTIRQVVSIMGRTKTCSPQGSVSGYKVC